MKEKNHKRFALAQEVFIGSFVMGLAKYQVWIRFTSNTRKKEDIRVD